MTESGSRPTLSGQRVGVEYEIQGTLQHATAVAAAIAVEDSIEFPLELVTDAYIRAGVVGRVEDVTSTTEGGCRARISYAVETVGGELPQLLNVIFGNASLLHGVRLVGLDVPPSALPGCAGPRFGETGVRELLGAVGRPLLATALKPMGSPVAALAETAYACAAGGIDIIKDDHGLANQEFATYRERVRACVQAVRAANAETGSTARYMPCVNGPADELWARAQYAVEQGAGGMLVIPGISGFDFMRALAADDTLAVPIIAHPAFLGSFVVGGTGGVAAGILFGTIMRLAGADMSIFPGFGGRFGLNRETCLEIANACREPRQGLLPAIPMVGGGMTLDRVGDLVGFYGGRTVLLIGGALRRGDLLENVRSFRAATERAARGQVTV